MHLVAALGFVAACGYGLADFLGAVASKRAGAIAAAFYVHCLGLLFLLAWYVVFVRSLPVVKVWAVAEILLASVSIACGGLTLYKAFDIGPVALVSPLGAVYPLVTTVISVVVFDVHLTGKQWIAVGLIVSGVMVASGSVAGTNILRFGRGPTLALLTSLSWGFGYVWLDRAIDRVGWQSAILLQMISITAVMGVVFLVRIRGQAHRGGKMSEILSSPAVVGAAATQLAADCAIVLGLAYDTAAGAVILSISACYPVITAVLALRYFRERFELVSLSAAMVAVAGIALLLL